MVSFVPISHFALLEIFGYLQVRFRISLPQALLFNRLTNLFIESAKINFEKGEDLKL